MKPPYNKGGSFFSLYAKKKGPLYKRTRRIERYVNGYGYEKWGKEQNNNSFQTFSFSFNSLANASPSLLPPSALLLSLPEGTASAVVIDSFLDSSLTSDDFSSDVDADFCSLDFDLVVVVAAAVVVDGSSSVESSQFSAMILSKAACLSACFFAFCLAFFAAFFDFVPPAPSPAPAPGTPAPTPAPAPDPDPDPDPGTDPSLDPDPEEGGAHPGICPAGSLLRSACCCRVLRKSLTSSCGVKPGLILSCLRTLFVSKVCVVCCKDLI